jgi:hypothetical protein
LLNPLTLGIWGIAQCWTTNKKEIVRFMEHGYVPANDMTKASLVEKGIL